VAVAQLDCPVSTLDEKPNPVTESAPAMVCGDPRSHAFRQRLERIAPSLAPVLVTGETGTGKELVARAVHARSGRADRPFIAVNAGAFSEQLIESELFGHERGAFTGAHSSQIGWFEAADGGTLFLDEIGELPLSLQVKLLRVLSTGEVTRLGSRSAIRVDVRLIAATNVDLLEAIRARRFREDLYYRLNVTSLALPPLRERPGDILPLAQHFLVRYAARLGKPSVRLGSGAAEALLRQPWPGNIRELENTIHQGLIVCRGAELSADDLGLGPNGLVRCARDGATSIWAPLEQSVSQLLRLGLPDLSARVESVLLSASFEYSGQNQLETARLLGLSRHVVRARLIEHGQLPGPLRRKGSDASLRPHSEPVRPPQAGRAVLRVGYQKLGLLMLIKANGAFDAALGSRNVSVAWQEYAGGIQIVEALRNGDLDVGVVGDCPAVFAQSERVPVVYIAAEPPAQRVAALLVPRQSDVHCVRDLRGKRVAVNRAAQAHYLLILALEEAGVTEGEVDIRFQTPERARRAFQTGDVDAWAIWDPWLSSARLDLGARVLRDTSGLFDSSVYYLARRELAERQPDLVRELCTQLRVAARWVESDPGRAAHLAAPILGLSPLVLAASLDRELSASSITPAQLEAQQRIADHCLRLQMIPHAVSVAAAQWPQPLSG
jgi:aliphatic sulfonates family ABC transporter substrate-binding protein